MQWRLIAKARRILESESGAIVSDWGGKVPVVLAYPNSYAVGMSSLAMHSLYRWFNALPGVVCERAFAFLDGHPSPAEPLITLESQRPVRDAAVLAISASFEMDYFNIVSMLRRAGVPLRAEERRPEHPFVILGGPAVAANPEPLAILADAIVIGEAEALLGDLIACVRDSWGRERLSVLEGLGRLPGVYVPLIRSGEAVARQWVPDLDAYPTASSIVAPGAEFGDMHLIEISRGCGWGCRFCLAGYWYRPPRERSLELILDQARQGLGRLKKVGLVAAAVSDYSRIEELVLGLRNLGAEISVSSLRVAPLSPLLVQALAEGGSRTLTLAPEAGSERLRRVINKCVSHEDILRAATLAALHRLEALKLYFMVGLPGESEGDIEELIGLCREVKEVFPRKLVVNLTPFVPKAHTPFERVAMAPEPLLDERLVRVQEALSRMQVEVRAELPREARVQGILARGDRRVGEALLGMRAPTPARWKAALHAQGLTEDEYLRERAPEEPLPWDFVDSRVAPAYLAAERRRAAEELVTGACIPVECSRCGVCTTKEQR